MNYIKAFVLFMLIGILEGMIEDEWKKNYKHKYLLKFPTCEPFDGCCYWLRKNLKFNAEIQQKAAQRKPQKKGKNDLKTPKKP